MTIRMPPLQPGWNAISYPLSVEQPVASALASIPEENRGAICEAEKDTQGCNSDSTPLELFKPNHVYWIEILSDVEVDWYLAPPTRQPDGKFGFALE